MNENDILIFEKINQNLTDGQLIKNYKELCALLDLPVFAGNQKKLQLKNLKRFMDFEKEGHKFIITQIYDSLKEQKERSFYAQYLKVLLMDLIVNGMNKDTNEKMYYSSSASDLFKALGMVSKKYEFNNYNFLKQLIPNLEEWEIINYYEWTNRKLKTILKSSLDSLEKERLITWSIDKVPYIKCGENEFKRISVNNQIIEQVLRIEHEVLLEMNLNSISQLTSGKLYRRFYTLRNEKAQKLYGYDTIQNEYKIIYLEEPIRKKLEYEKKKMLKDALNEEIVNGMKKSINKIIEDKNNESDRYLEHLRDQKQIAIGKLPNFYFIKESFNINYYRNEEESNKHINELINRTIVIKEENESDT